MDSDEKQALGGQACNMWAAGEYKAFDTARDQQCARATGTVTKWVVEML